MAGNTDRNVKALQEVWRREENTLCADCEKTDPDWASYTLGIFLCLDCAGIHRKIPSISKVKSIRMDCWEEGQIEYERGRYHRCHGNSDSPSLHPSTTDLEKVVRMEYNSQIPQPARPGAMLTGEILGMFLVQHGNAKAKAKYEAHVPSYYYHPVHADCLVLREQWIRAKYERKEFMKPGKQPLSSNGVKEGILWKRGRDNGQYLPRRFLLSEREGCLKYFTKQDAKEPKVVVKIDTINAVFQPEKTGNPNGLQITYLKDNKTRNIFLYHEDGKEIVDWFNAVRAVQFHYLKVAFPVASDEELRNRLTRNFLKEGYMEKTGPRQKEAFKKRWFTLDHRRLMYFKDPLDAFAKGEVFVGSGEQGYSVMEGLPAGTQGNFTWHYGITIVTPDRDYLFTCETERDQQEWLAAFRHVIKQPMTPQEYAIEAYFKLKP